MKQLKEFQKNIKRADALSKDQRELLTFLTQIEFEKPVSERNTPVMLLDFVEFGIKKATTNQ